VSRAARGHVRGGLAHTQREVRIGARRRELSQSFLKSTSCVRRVWRANSERLPPLTSIFEFRIL
jgi:hypothetical protein